MDGWRIIFYSSVHIPAGTPSPFALGCTRATGDGSACAPTILSKFHKAHSRAPLHHHMTIFSKIISGEIPCHKIWEDDRFFAFLDINPIQPGMTILVPKLEISDGFEMTDDLYCAWMLAAKKLIPAIKAASGSERVGLVIEGLEVPHAHIKLIPISHPGDLAQSNAKPASAEDLATMAEKIRDQLS
jgi:histidine triad (HIT) family protein